MDLLQALNAPKGQTHTKDYIRKTHALVTLWKDTAELAAEEDKLPMLGIVEKGRHGFWFMCHHGDLRLILEHIDHTHKLPEGEDLATWMSMRYNAN